MGSVIRRLYTNREQATSRGGRGNLGVIKGGGKESEKGKEKKTLSSQEERFQVFDEEETLEVATM